MKALVTVGVCVSMAVAALGDYVLYERSSGDVLTGGDGAAIVLSDSARVTQDQVSDKDGSGATLRPNWANVGIKRAATIPAEVVNVSELVDAAEVDPAEAERDVSSIADPALRVLAETSRVLAAKMVRADELSEEEMAEIVDVFPVWAVGTAYVLGDVVRHEGGLYACVQAHTSQAGWAPPAVPALWTEKAAPNVIAEWVQPTGAQDAYQLGDMVTHAGLTWRSTAADNVWEPGVYGWEEVTQ